MSSNTLLEAIDGKFETKIVDHGHKYTFFLPAIDFDMARRVAFILKQRSGHPFRLLIIHDTLRIGFVRCCNEAFVRTRSEFVGYLAQDVFPSWGWLKIADDVLTETKKDLFAFNDGLWKSQIAAFGIARRSWLSSIYGGSNMFCPEYKSHYCDTELTAIARARNEFCAHPYSIMMEVDFNKESKPVDESDRALYCKRRETILYDLCVPSAGDDESKRAQALSFLRMFS